MPKAYVLINCELDHKSEVMDEITRLPGIVDSAELYGAYDILVKLNRETIEELKETIKLKVKKISYITSVVALVATESIERKS